MNRISDFNLEDKLNHSLHTSSDCSYTEFVNNLAPEITQELAKVSVLASQIMQKDLLFILEQLREQEFDLSITTETILQNNSFEINEKF